MKCVANKGKETGSQLMWVAGDYDAYGIAGKTQEQDYRPALCLQLWSSPPSSVNPSERHLQMGSWAHVLQVEQTPVASCI